MACKRHNIHHFVDLAGRACCPETHHAPSLQRESFQVQRFGGVYFANGGIDHTIRIRTSALLRNFPQHVLPRPLLGSNSAHVALTARGHADAHLQKAAVRHTPVKHRFMSPISSPPSNWRIARRSSASSPASDFVSGKSVTSVASVTLSLPDTGANQSIRNRCNRCNRLVGWWEIALPRISQVGGFVPFHDTSVDSNGFRFDVVGPQFGR